MVNNNPFKSKKRKHDYQNINGKPSKRVKIVPHSTILPDAQIDNDSNATFMSLPVEIQQYILIDLSPMQSVINFSLVNVWFYKNVYKHFIHLLDNHIMQSPNITYFFDKTITFSQWKNHSIKIQLEHAIVETLRLLNNQAKLITIIQNNHASDEQINQLNTLFSIAHNHLDELKNLELESAQELSSKENRNKMKQSMDLIQEIKDFVANITDPIYKRWIIKL